MSKIYSIRRYSIINLVNRDINDHKTSSETKEKCIWDINMMGLLYLYTETLVEPLQFIADTRQSMNCDLGSITTALQVVADTEIHSKLDLI